MAELAYSKPSLAEEEYSDFSRQFSLKPPASFKHQYMRVSGGSIEESEAEAGLWGLPVTGLIAIKYGRVPIERLAKDIRSISPASDRSGGWKAGEFLPFSSDYGGNVIFISLKRSDCGLVYIYDSDGGNISVMAPNFEEFIRKLYNYEQGEEESHD
jgi:hypothetical protein